MKNTFLLENVIGFLNKLVKMELEDRLKIGNTFIRPLMGMSLKFQVEKLTCEMMKSFLEPKGIPCFGKRKAQLVEEVYKLFEDE